MKADLIIIGNRIFDSVEENPFHGFIAISGNRILKVGRGENYHPWLGEDTQILTYHDQTIMAGFHDSHTHLLMAGMYRTYVNLSEARSEEEAAKMVWESVKNDLHKGGWVIGFSWYHVFWDHRELPTKKSLDYYFPEKPVCLINAEAHGAWVNSAGLSIAGITKDMPDPFGGKIERDSQGEPTGFLYESAVGLATKYAFVLNEEEEKQLIQSFQEGAKKFGITSINDVQPYFQGNMGNLEVYHQMDKGNSLTVRVHAAPDLLGDLDQVEVWREKYGSEKVRVNHVKQFLDGVSTTHTALVLEDYEDEPGNRGISLFDLEAIRKAVPEAHRRGFSVKLHSCGDASARLGLDFYEEAVELYGRNRCRHAIEHIEMLAPEDLPRFKELGVLPSVQPEHIALTQRFDENPYPIVLGQERADKTWPLKSLYDTAGVLAIGSDCPVVSNNPFLEIYRGVTRLHNDGMPEGGWNPTEKLSLYEVLRSYTYGSAYGVGREDEMGTLEKGKFADIVVLDRDLFRVPHEEILDTKVVLTVFDGKIIHKE
jgi:hypothetical protein